jgi:putative DNA primase/helicase
MIQTSDQTNAFYRRLLIISFPNIFEEDKQDTDLIRKLTSEKELSGNFNILMFYLRLIINNNGIYLDERNIAERRLKHERTTNPVKACLDEVMVEDSLADDYISKAVLYGAYKRFCKKYKSPIKSQVGFGKEIAKLQILTSDKESKGDRQTIWKGIRLTPEYHTDSEQSTSFQ